VFLQALSTVENSEEVIYDSSSCCDLFLPALEEFFLNAKKGIMYKGSLEML